jgi:hypothetical protein
MNAANAKPPCQQNPLPFSRDPLRGAHGAHWFERRPESLTRRESREMQRALDDGRITWAQYYDWLEHVG